MDEHSPPKKPDESTDVVQKYSILLEEVHRRYDDIERQLEGIKTKAGLLVVAYGILFSGLLNAIVAHKSCLFLYILPVVIVGGFYAGRSIYPKPYFVNPILERLEEFMKMETAEKVQKQLLLDIRKAAEMSQTSIKNSQRDIKYGFWLLFISVIITAILLVLQVYLCYL